MKESKLVAILKYGIYAVALIPLIIFSDFLSPFHFGKVVIFRAWMEILAFLYVILILNNRNYLPKINSVFWVVTFFTLAFGLTTLTSVDSYQSFWGTLERMGGWFTFFHFWLFFVVAVSILKKKEDWLTFIKVSVFASLLSTLYGLLQKTDWQFIVGSGGRARIFGTIGNTALFAGYELLNIFLALILIFWPKISKGEKWFYAFVFLLDLLALFSTAVRGSLAAIVIGLALFVFLFSYVGEVGSTVKKVRKLFVWGLGALIVLELFLVFNHNSQFVQNSGYLSRLSDVSLQTRTVNTRFWAWRAGLEGWIESPKKIMLGWGPENFNIPFSKHFNPKFYLGPGSETLFDRGHNMFVEVLVTMGLIGLAAYLGLFWVLFRVLKNIFSKSNHQEYKVVAAILTSGLVAYLIHNTFIFDTSANFMVFFLIMGMVYFLKESDNGRPAAEVAQAFGKQGQVPEPKGIKLNAQFNIGVGVLLTTFIAVTLFILVTFSIYQTDIKPTLANYATTRAIVVSWDADAFWSKKDFKQARVLYAGATAKFNEAISYNTFGAYDIRHRYAQYAIEEFGRLDSADRLNIFLSLIEEIKKNIHSADQDYLPHLYISRAYILLGKDDPKSLYNDLALEQSLRALEIAPTFIRTYFEVAQGYLNKKDYKKAAEYFRDAAELNPDVGLSYWYWAVAEIESGNTDKGLELAKTAQAKGYNLSEAESSRLLPAYVKKGDFKEVAKIYEALIASSPKNPQLHASLAAVYQKLGMINEAIAEARKSAALDSSFEGEARNFIRALGKEF